jgi:hypothetical protein
MTGSESFTVTHTNWSNSPSDLPRSFEAPPVVESSDIFSSGAAKTAKPADGSDVLSGAANDKRTPADPDKPADVDRDVIPSLPRARGVPDRAVLARRVADDLRQELVDRVGLTLHVAMGNKGCVESGALCQEVIYTLGV